MKSIETYKEIIPEFVIKLYHILEVLKPEPRKINSKTSYVGQKKGQRF